MQNTLVIYDENFLLDPQSGGFYVRTLIVDIAREAQCRAHMTKLLRTKQGSFVIKDCIYEKDWSFDVLCDGIRRCTSLKDNSPPL